MGFISQIAVNISLCLSAVRQRILFSSSLPPKVLSFGLFTYYVQPFGRNIFQPLLVPTQVILLG